VVLRGALVDQHLHDLALTGALDGLGAHRHPAVRDDDDGVQREPDQHERHPTPPNVERCEQDE